MTNEEMLADLKEFMTVTVRAEVNAALDEKLEEKFEQKLEEKLKPIDQKIDDLTDFVRESHDISNKTTGEQIADLDRRVTKLEQAAA